MYFHFIILFYFITASDLVDVLYSVIDVTDWESLGLALGLSPPELDRVRRDGYNEKDRQRKMVSLWLDTGIASWKGLTIALLNPIVKREELAKRISEQHPLL